MFSRAPLWLSTGLGIYDVYKGTFMTLLLYGCFGLCNDFKRHLKTHLLAVLMTSVTQRLGGLRGESCYDAPIKSIVSIVR